jgi:Rhodopirellula transposase DDE domain
MCFVADADEAVLAEKFAVMRQVLDERAWRVYLGTEARALGYGGVAAVARAAGASETTVAAGVREAADREALSALAPGRARRQGAGRPRAEESQPGLMPALRGLVEPGKRGDPVVAVTWTTLSLRDLERQLAGLGFRCGKDALARMLHEDGFSLQGMSRVAEGEQHPDRDAQFRRVNALVAEFTAAGDPVVSVDGKKKEQLGPFHRPGRSWRPAGDPVRVRDHDFPDAELGRITPYGVYDIAANTGFVSVGTSHDTAAFAVNAIRLWHRQEGAARYPGARRLLVTCDAGGSNSCTGRLWKDELAALAAETGLEITVAHFPPGTSKWNKIEHRLFCHITRTWKARPLMTREDAVAGIAATTTYQGLKATAVLDGAEYPDKVKISDRRMKYLEERVLDRDRFHGEWNYTARPAAPQEPAPGPAPGPDLEALAALAGIADLPALLHAAVPAWEAARDYRLALARGRPRIKGTAAGVRKLTPAAAVTAAACRIRLGMTWTLLGRLTGTWNTTIRDAALDAIPVLEHLGITAAGGPPITTRDALRQHAAAAGITINGITHQAARKDGNQHDTPETAN